MGTFLRSGDSSEKLSFTVAALPVIRQELRSCIPIYFIFFFFFFVRSWSLELRSEAEFADTLLAGSLGLCLTMHN